eukprot:Em0022g940a
MSMDDSDSNEESPEQDYSKKPLLKDSEKAENDQDKDEELLALETSKAEKRRRWISIYIMYFTMFLSSITFSIAISAIYPYLLEIDPTATATFLGFVVAAYSLGQLLASPFFGFWSDRRPTREPLMVSLLINLIFNVLYAYAGAFPSAVAGYVLLVSRFFVGFGAGNAATTRAYVSYATTVSERTSAMASISAAQGLGFIIGPALGLAFVPLGSGGLTIRAIRFTFNIYTGPGYLNAGLGIINLVLLFFVQNIKAQSFTTTTTSTMTVNSNPAEKKMVKVTAESDLSLSTAPLPPYDRLAVIITLFLCFIVFFVFTVYETIVSPLSLDEFAWSKNHAVLYNNIMFAAMAVISVATFIGIKIGSSKKLFDERVLFMIGLFIIALSFFVLIPMGNEPLSVTPSGIDDTVSNTSINASIPEFNISSYRELVGCHYPVQSWCVNQPRVYLVQYIISLVLMAIGYSAGNAMCYSIFSKIMGHFPQGTMTGLLNASGSLARTVGPIFVTFLYDQLGPLITFPIVTGLMAVSIVIVLMSCSRLVPYGAKRRC